jgi:serine/threonine-protein kinase
MRDASGRLYLLDFGAVKQVATGGAPAARSTGIYSMGFAPPEQMAGAQVYPATDLYALAATCLNLLTGKPAEELYDAYHNHWDWRSHAPQVTYRLADTLNRMLLPAPKDRFQSARAVLAALHPAPGAAATALQAPAQSSTAAAPAPPRRPAASFSVLEILAGAAFTGFQGSLVAIACYSLLAAPGIILGFMAAAGLVFLQSRRLIEGKDLLIIPVLTALLLFLLPVLRGNFPLPQILLIATLAGIAAIAVTAIFRLIYQLLLRL